MLLWIGFTAYNMLKRIINTIVPCLVQFYFKRLRYSHWKPYAQIRLFTMVAMIDCCSSYFNNDDTMTVIYSSYSKHNSLVFTAFGVITYAVWNPIWLHKMLLLCLFMKKDLSNLCAQNGWPTFKDIWDFSNNSWT